MIQKSGCDHVIVRLFFSFFFFVGWGGARHGGAEKQKKRKEGERECSGFCGGVIPPVDIFISDHGFARISNSRIL